MKRSIPWTAAVVAFLLALLVASMVRVGPDEVGVLTRNVGFGSQGGVVSEDFGPGWHLNVPMIHHWTILPARVRRVELTKDPRHRSPLGDDALLVQSSDGDRVIVDLEVFYRILPGHAHKLVQDSGVGDGHVRVLKSLARDSLRVVFGTLDTEQFYDPQARHEKSREAITELRAALAPRSLEVVDILVLDIEFEPKYEQKIKDKKLADQSGELNKAQARSAKERAVVAGIQLETTKQVKLIETTAEAESARIRAEAEKHAAQRRAEADLYRSQLTAKGNLAVARAEAKVKRAKTAALGGSGGANLAALEAVSKIKIDSIAFPTGGSDWFDVRTMATRLGARP